MSTPQIDPADRFEEILQSAREIRLKAARAEVGYGASDPVLLSGRDFLFSRGHEAVAVWGSGEQVLWSEGEVLIVAGPPGVGKSTLIQHLVLGRLGIADSVLEYPVASDERKVLLLSLDRPPQFARSMRRMVDETQCGEVLADRLVVCTDLGFDIGEKPDVLAHLVTEQEAGTVVVDSAYCAALGLQKDDKMSNAMRAFRQCEAAGARVVVVHHTRKSSTSDSASPSLESMFGSQILAAGAGSVVMLRKETRERVLLAHRKSPMAPVPEQRFAIDHDTGAIRSLRERSVLEVLASRPSESLSPREIAEVACSVISEGEKQRIRRELAKLFESGRVEVAAVSGQTNLWRITKKGLGAVEMSVGLADLNESANEYSMRTNKQPTEGNGASKSPKPNAPLNRESDVGTERHPLTLEPLEESRGRERREPE